MDCRQQLHRSNSCSEHKQTTTTAGEMGCEGNSPGGDFLELRCYNYSNSADTRFQQASTAFLSRCDGNPVIIPLIFHPGRSTGQRRSILARWDENTHIRLWPHGGQFVETPLSSHPSIRQPPSGPRGVHVKSVWGSHSSGPRGASSLPLLLKIEREIREGRAFQQSSRSSIIPFTHSTLHPPPTPPPVPRLPPPFLHLMESSRGQWLWRVCVGAATISHVQTHIRDIK